MAINIHGANVNKGKERKLLGVKSSIKLLIESDIANLCKKTSQKIHALDKLVDFMELCQVRGLMKAFITSQFNHCP